MNEAGLHVCVGGTCNLIFNENHGLLQTMYLVTMGK